jgi:hypothetical protein
MLSKNVPEVTSEKNKTDHTSSQGICNVEDEQVNLNGNALNSSEVDPHAAVNKVNGSIPDSMKYCDEQDQIRA